MRVTAQSQIVRSGATALAVHPLGLFVGRAKVLGDPNGGSVYRSVDNGENWKTTDLKNVHQVCCFSKANFGQQNLFAADQAIIAGTYNGYYLSDNGSHWQKLSWPMKSIRSLRWIDQERLLIGSSEGVFLVKCGQPPEKMKLPVNGQSCHFAVDEQSGRWLAYNLAGAYQSTDAGVSWQKLDLPGSLDCRALLIQPKTGELWLGTDRGLFNQLSGERKWQPQTMAAKESGRLITSIIWHNDCLFVATGLFVFCWSQETGWRELWYSADNIVSLNPAGNHLFVLSQNFAWRLDLGK